MDSLPDNRIEPLRCDRWTALSVLQKAIRRGQSQVAQAAALMLHQEKRSDVARRLLIIGFEDIGAANPDVLNGIRHTLGSSEWRQAKDRDRVLLQLVSELAQSPKDRSTDYLAVAADQLPACREFAQRCSLMSPDEQSGVLGDFSKPLQLRSVAALQLMGRRGPGLRYPPPIHTEALASTYRQLGVATGFIETAVFAAKKTREPITLLAPLIRLEVKRSGPALIAEPALPETEFIDGVPLYAFDKHTRLGKRAIGELVRADTALKSCLKEFVPPSRWQAAAEMAAFYADAAPIALRLEWTLSHVIEALGTQADFFMAGVPANAVQPVQAAMAAALGCLNEVRKALWIKSRASNGPTV